MIYMHTSECAGNAVDHNLDLSLGGSASKQNSLEFGEDIHQHTMETDWRNNGLRPKVCWLDPVWISFGL